MNTLIRNQLSSEKNSTSITVFTRKGEIGKIDDLVIKYTNKKVTELDSPDNLMFQMTVPRQKTY